MITNRQALCFLKQLKTNIFPQFGHTRRRFIKRRKNPEEYGY